MSESCIEDHGAWMGTPRCFGAWIVAGLLLAGCGHNSDIADCAGQVEGRAQEDCRLAALLGVDVDAARRAIAEVPSASSRDLLRVRLVVSDPRRFGPLCDDVRHSGSRDWCREVLDRPHLELDHPR